MFIGFSYTDTIERRIMSFPKFKRTFKTLICTAQSIVRQQMEADETCRDLEMTLRQTVVLGITEA